MSEWSIRAHLESVTTDIPERRDFGAAMGIAAERTVTLHAGRYNLNLAPSAGASRVGMIAVVHLRAWPANQ